MKRICVGDIIRIGSITSLVTAINADAYDTELYLDDGCIVYADNVELVSEATPNTLEAAKLLIKEC